MSLFLLWLVLLSIFLVQSSSLLLSLLILEILSFFLIFLISISFCSLVSIEFLLLAFFCVFVIEGVIAISGLVILVSFSGSDYIRSSSVVKF